MRNLLTPLCTLWLGTSLFALAQAPQPSAEPRPSAGPGETKDTAGKGKKSANPRLQKLQQLNYDRRASAIFRLWKQPTVPKKTEKPKGPLDLELETLQHQVTLGRWKEVKAYLAKLPEEEGKAAYTRMLQSLQQGPATPQGGHTPSASALAELLLQEREKSAIAIEDIAALTELLNQFQERNVFTMNDLMGLAAAAPKKLAKEHLASLGGIVMQVLKSGTVVESVVERLRNETQKPANEAALTARQAARVLAACGQAAEIASFLPNQEQAGKDKDVEALNLWALHFIALHSKQKKIAPLEKAWLATQAALAFPEAPDEQREQALRRAVELAPQVTKQLGQTWLDDSFRRHPERGRAILGTIGNLAAQGVQLHPKKPDQRLNELRLQKTAVEALLKADRERARRWQPTLQLLATTWLHEAEIARRFDTSGSGDPSLRHDRYGNMFFLGDEPNRAATESANPRQPMPIKSVELLEVRPSDVWLALLEAGTQAKLTLLCAQLYLKINDEMKALPYIEQLAPAHRDLARDLVNEFLRVWVHNHNPNEQRTNRSPYFYFFGFGRQAEGIPLTRSKQERNLRELAGVVARLRKLPVGDPDEELLAKAFTTCHSSAEVYRLEAIERVFGPIGGLKPRTLAGLIQQMRENLAGLWRKPETQEEKKTKRKPQDIQREVLRGYELARAVLDGARQKFPDDWSLLLAHAALEHDENNYRQELARSSNFSSRRAAALAKFAQAARHYAVAAKDLKEDQESIKVFEQWFYASLGACDLAQMNEEQSPDPRQPPSIREAIDALPGKSAERHRSKFANRLLTELRSVKPQLKFHYLRAGLEIVGNDPQAREARKVFDYYKDLVTEIKLQTALDGSSDVAYPQRFGVFVNIVHTREIERESGGFGRYLQNQNSGRSYFYNFGRPPVDYRDRFQAAATEALKEHFEVLSVTFQNDKVMSRAAAEYGWRVTPYAYLLLKARDRRIDKVPPLRLDLDFLDTSSYVIIPVESPAIPIDAGSAKSSPRPFRRLQVTQVLDERQADKGKLLLEVKAVARGLVPDLPEILDLNPAEFQIAKTQDLGVSVAKFDEDQTENAIVSERTWLFTLEAKPELERAPEIFQFGAPRVEGAEMAYQRYADADLVSAGREVPLEASYGTRSYRWAWWLGGGAAAALALLAAAVTAFRRRSRKTVAAWMVPERLTPFTLLGLLRRIEAIDGLTEKQRLEMRSAVEQLERRYFAGETNGEGELDLAGIAKRWIRQVQIVSDKHATNDKMDNFSLSDSDGAG